MSATDAIWYLLKTNAPVLAVVPAASIKSGALPQNTVYPAIAVSQISSVPMNLIRINEPKKMHTERVQVTAYHKSYTSLKALMKLILAACPSQRGTVNGVVIDSIVPAGEGPDIYDTVTELNSRSRDFIVRYVGA